MATTKLSTAELLAEVPDDLVAQFKPQFLEQFSKEIANGQFDQRDVDSMLDETRIRCYLTLAEFDMKLALKSTKEMFIWRREFGIRDITFDDIPKPLLRGLMFFRGKDQEGNNLFWFRAKFNKKGQMNTEKKRLFAYMLEQHYQTFPGERITFIFDMTDCGLGQADMDVLRFMINCFQHHFPVSVNNLVVYKLPWILEGVWKIVKTWLPARSQEKVKFVSGDAIDPFVNKENRFKHMGDGFDTFSEMHPDGDDIFKLFSDLYTGTKRVSAQHSASFASLSNANAETVDDNNDDVEQVVEQPEDHQSPQDRSSKMSFFSDSPTEIASEAVGLDERSSSATKHGDGGDLTPTMQRKAQVRNSRSASQNAPLLEFSPDFAILFDTSTTQSDLIEASVHLRNVSGGIVAFKVKSTSMTRYRSRPCAGFIQPNTIRHCHISCRAEDRNVLFNDRFLIQYMQVSDRVLQEASQKGVPLASAASKYLSANNNNETVFEKR